MISASKTSLSLTNLKIIRPKVTKKLQICIVSFVNPHPDPLLPYQEQSILQHLTNWDRDRRRDILEIKHGSIQSTRAKRVFTHTLYTTNMHYDFFYRMVFLEKKRLQKIERLFISA